MISLIFVSVLVGLVGGYPRGPPDEACDDMTPGHGVSAQWSSSPYSLSVDKTWYKEGEPITVQVQGPAFKGMILQARKTYGGSPIGKFSKPTDVGMWIKECEWPQDTVAHNSSNEKYNPSFVWWPPKESEGNLVFVATIVEQKTVFWTSIRSGTLYPSYDKSGMWPHTAGQSRPIAAFTALVACLAAILI